MEGDQPQAKKLNKKVFYETTHLVSGAKSKISEDGLKQAQEYAVKLGMPLQFSVGKRIEE